MPKRTLPPLVDPPALAAYLSGRIPAGGPITVTRHTAGHSCETFFVRSGSHRWVLRRPPRPPYLPTAHDVAREFRVMQALGPTPVRVPRVVLLCTDDSVIGAPFYLMEEVEGQVIRDAMPRSFADVDRARVGEELVDALAELHALDPRDAGLDDFGRPHGYVDRQIARWTKQLDGAAAETARVREVPDLRTVAERLASRVPPPSGPPAVVHGDYKLDNVMFGPASPARLVAILDWEMSTIGEPLADLGWMLAAWRRPGDDPDPRRTEAQEPTRLPGFPSRDELVSRYERTTGRDVGDISFYLALAVWKLAVILEGSYARHLRGTTDDPMFEKLEWAVPALGARAIRELGT